MSLFEKKSIRLFSVTALYICLLSTSILILIKNTHHYDHSKKAPVKTFITNEVRTLSNLSKIRDAQQQYRTIDWNNDNVKSFAQFNAHLWQTVDKFSYPVESRLLSKKLAFAIGPTKAVSGYFFEPIYYKMTQQKESIETNSNADSQDENKELIDYVNEWAVAAFPARYQTTGVLTFIIHATGNIYAKDVKSEQVKYLPDNYISKGWSKISGKADIEALHMQKKN